MHGRAMNGPAMDSQAMFEATAPGPTAENPNA